MSTPLPPEDQPTTRLARPRAPREPVVPVGPVAGDPYYAEPPVATAVLADSVRSLRNALVVLALLTVAALILGAYALNQATKDDSNGRGASQARVAKLEDRVDRLASLVKDTRSDVATLKAGAAGAKPAVAADSASSSDLESLRTSVKTLDSRVSELSGKTGGDNSQAAIDALGQRIDQVSQQLKDLQSAQQQTP